MFIFLCIQLSLRFELWLNPIWKTPSHNYNNIEWAPWRAQRNRNFIENTKYQQRSRTNKKPQQKKKQAKVRNIIKDEEKKREVESTFDTVQVIWSNAHSFTIWILLEFLLCVIALIGIRQIYTKELRIHRELRGIKKMHKMVFNVNGERNRKNIIVLSLNNEFRHTPATVPSKLLIQMIWMIQGTAHAKLKHLISSCNFLLDEQRKRSVINKKFFFWKKKKTSKNYMDKKLWDHFGFWFEKVCLCDLLDCPWVVCLPISLCYSVAGRTTLFIWIVILKWSGAKTIFFFFFEFLLLLFIRGFLCDSIDHLLDSGHHWRRFIVFYLSYSVCRIRIHSANLMYAVINLYCVHSHKWLYSWFFLKKKKSIINVIEAWHPDKRNNTQNHANL